MVIATWTLAIITAFYATITFYMLLIMKRDRERKVIVEIVKDFLIPTIDTLKEDRKQFNKINISYFPDLLDLQFGIHTRFLKGAIFDRFAKRKPLLKRKILKYNELCSKFSKEIEEFKKIAHDEGMVNSQQNKECPGGRTVIVDQYENEDITKILKEKGLEQKIEDIAISIEGFGLDKKAEKLIRKLEKIEEKFRDKYNLTDKELGW
jgi:hypothetical protein